MSFPIFDLITQQESSGGNTLLELLQYWVVIGGKYSELQIIVGLMIKPPEVMPILNSASEVSFTPQIISLQTSAVVLLILEAIVLSGIPTVRH